MRGIEGVRGERDRRGMKVKGVRCVFGVRGIFFHNQYHCMTHFIFDTLPAGSNGLPSSLNLNLNCVVFTIQYGQYTTIDRCPPLPKVFST